MSESVHLFPFRRSLISFYTACALSAEHALVLLKLCPLCTAPSHLASGRIQGFLYKFWTNLIISLAKFSVTIDCS